MTIQHRLVQPAPAADFRTANGRALGLGEQRVIRTAEGYPLEVPADWELLPPGDAMLTRRVKAAGEVWVMQQRKGRRMMSRGVWAPADRIARIRAEVEAARADPSYQKKLDAGRTKRAAQQVDYAQDFELAIAAFLNFAPRHQAMSHAMAKLVADHAVPVGSGTVARTQRIPIEERARAAVIAWMRHHTTNYDRMTIPRIKGKRREVRRKLAKQSIAMLRAYREDDPIPIPNTCSLQKAIAVLG